MTLSGELGFVPIDEVLRLLTRSRQQGAVDVTGIGFRGRIFVGSRGVDLASTWDDGELHQHLLNSGYVDEKSLDRITSGESTLAVIAENNNEMIELLREMTIESLYQVNKQGDEFRVVEGRTTPYASPKAFDLETLLDDVKDRQRDWEKVSDVISDLTGPMAFRRDLGDREEVTIKTDDWKLLSEIGAGASVSEIAERLGTTQFWAAKVAARLISNDLVGVPVEEDVDEPAADREWSEPAYEPEASADEEQFERSEVDDPYGHPSMDEDVAEVEDVAVADVSAEDPSEESAHGDSWWQEPADEPAGTSDDGSSTPEVVAEGLSEIPAVEEPEDDGDEDVAEDTEAFLEKVFSELESDEPKAEEGHGLLRRRRMGTLRDFSSDS